jgi:hypothetical protein
VNNLAEVVALLFEVFATRFGHRWTRTYEDPLARKVWRRDLEVEGLTPDDVKAGLRRTARLEWPPSLGEFVAACRPEAADLGMPEAREAYVAACRGQWRLHPIVWHVASIIGSHDLRSRPEAETWPRFEAAYKVALSQAQQGRVFAFPEPRHVALPAPPPVAPMTAAEALAAMRKAIGRTAKP